MKLEDQVNYDNLTEFQRGIKRGIVFCVREALVSLPEHLRTEEMIKITVESLWDNYMEKED